MRHIAFDDPLIMYSLVTIVIYTIAFDDPLIMYSLVTIVITASFDLITMIMLWCDCIIQIMKLLE